jgi:chromosome segregation ATPase
MPGTYKAVVAKRIDGVVTPIGPAQEFQVVVEGQENMSISDRTALVEFQQKAVRLQRAVSGATQAANALRPRLTAIKRAIAETPSLPPRLYEDAMALEKRANEIVRALSGDAAARQRNMNTPSSINDRVGYVVGAQRMSTARPTQTQHAQYTAAAQDFEGVLGRLRQLIDVDLARLEKQLEAGGAPWTPGRIPEWKDQ